MAAETTQAPVGINSPTTIFHVIDDILADDQTFLGKKFSEYSTLGIDKQKQQFYTHAYCRNAGPYKLIYNQIEFMFRILHAHLPPFLHPGNSTSRYMFWLFIAGTIFADVVSQGMGSFRNLEHIKKNYLVDRVLLYKSAELFQRLLTEFYGANTKTRALFVGHLLRSSSSTKSNLPYEFTRIRFHLYTLDFLAKVRPLYNIRAPVKIPLFTRSYDEQVINVIVAEQFNYGGYDQFTRETIRLQTYFRTIRLLDDGNLTLFQITRLEKGASMLDVVQHSSDERMKDRVNGFVKNTNWDFRSKMLLHRKQTRTTIYDLGGHPYTHSVREGKLVSRV